VGRLPFKERKGKNVNEPNLEILNTHDVAKIMKCGVRKIQRLAASGDLPMKLFGGEYVITLKRLEEFLAS
jgi:Helix-turn-helix domain